MGITLLSGLSQAVPAWLREGTFFLRGAGRAGEFCYFFPKKVLALPCLFNKTTPDPHL